MTRSIKAFATVLFLAYASHQSAQSQALDAIPRPLVSQPKLAMQAVDVARGHWKAGRIAQALKAIEAALLDEPQDLSLRFMRGSLLYESSRFEESIKQFSELAEQFPELAEIHNNLAGLYAREGKLDLARLSLERALQAQPAYALAWENLASVLARLSVQALQRAGDHSKDAERRRIDSKIKIARELTERILKP
jgi:tetratricopeptide (TPR) repeat protein